MPLPKILNRPDKGAAASSSLAVFAVPGAAQWREAAAKAVRVFGDAEVLLSRAESLPAPQDVAKGDLEARTQEARGIAQELRALVDVARGAGVEVKATAALFHASEACHVRAAAYRKRREELDAAPSAALARRNAEDAARIAAGEAFARKEADVLAGVDELIARAKAGDTGAAATLESLRRQASAPVPVTA